jgi:hypothetical protein
MSGPARMEQWKPEEQRPYHPDGADKGYDRFATVTESILELDLI